MTDEPHSLTASDDTPATAAPLADAPAPDAPPPAFPAPTSESAAAARSTVQLSETLQTLLTALLLAFVFRAFLIEAFIIPTGSMAEGLLGEHITVRCPRCGWEFDIGHSSEHDSGEVHKLVATCPSCGLVLDADAVARLPIKSGDRLLVFKWPYALGGWCAPRRWDVIVFRNPGNPDESYIKRLIGLPGEAVELRDGDVFIDGRIAPKTPAAQASLWFLVADQDYLAAPASAPRASAWVAEPASGPDAGWTGLDTRVIHCSATAAEPRRLALHRSIRDTYAYDEVPDRVPVGDLRLRTEVTWSGGAGWLRVELERASRTFTADFHADGRVVLRMCVGDEPWRELGVARIAPWRKGAPRACEFTHVDRRVSVAVDGRELLATSERDYPRTLVAAMTEPHRTGAKLALVAADAELELRGLRVDRDVYYLDTADTRRADAAHPLRLEADEFFVLGDNSPASQDGRVWTVVDEQVAEFYRAHGLPEYRAGTVRRELIVGRAFFVYLPGLLPLDAHGTSCVPDLGRARFVR